MSKNNGKLFPDWLKEFKDSGFGDDPTTWPEEGKPVAGTIEITENGEHDVTNYATANVNVSGGADISPAVMITGGTKVTVDFSVGTYIIGSNDLYANGKVIDVVTDDDYSIRIVSVFPNDSNTQLIACMGEDGSGPAYVSTSNQVVIYEGDVTGLQDTSTIASSLPTVEFTVIDTNDKTIFKPNPNLSFTVEN